MMNQTQNKLFPESMLNWMVARPNQQILNLGGTAFLPTSLQHLGHQILSIDKDFEQVRKLLSRNIFAIVAQAEMLPFKPQLFDVVTTHQMLHKFNLSLVLRQVGMVLKPNGCFSFSYLVRDDSVPWVRRMIKIIQQYDPMAMQGNYGIEAVATVEKCRYFVRIEHQQSRIWRPISKPDLIKMALSKTMTSSLKTDQQEFLTNQLTELYDDATGPLGTLRLPFSLHCWRAWIDQEQLTTPIELPDNALRINV